MTWIIKLSNGTYYARMDHPDPSSVPIVSFEEKQSKAFRFSHKEDACWINNYLKGKGSKLLKLKKKLPQAEIKEESKLKDTLDLNKERARQTACDTVEEWIKSISKEFCSINFNHEMNEVKINFEELPRSGFIDHGSLYDSLCACEEEMKTYRGFEPKPGTVFVHDRDTYVVTSIENTDEGVKYVFVNSYGWSQVDSWGTLSSYIKGLKDNKIEMLWEPKG